MCDGEHDEYAGQPFRPICGDDVYAVEQQAAYERMFRVVWQGTD